MSDIEDQTPFRGDLPMSGEFNVLLVVKFRSTADMASNKAKYEAFMKEWGEVRHVTVKQSMRPSSLHWHCTETGASKGPC